MSSSPRNFSIDDKDLDDAELWAVIDSAAAASHSSTKPRKPLTTLIQSLSPPPSKSLHSSFNLVIQSPNHSSKSSNNKRNYSSTVEENDSTRVSPNSEVLQESSSWSHSRNKIVKRNGSGFGDENRMVVVNQQQQRTTPKTPPCLYSYSSPVCEISPGSENSPNCFQGEEMVHSLSGRFPSVSLFKEYQNKAMAILEKSDWTMISGSPYIKKSGWRKIAFYFNVSFEIKDKSIELDENRNVQRAEFTVRAHMQGGRFSDGWGSCERREKRFMKPNQDIPSTAETRAKNKACQDLLGIGQYRSGT